MSDTAAAASAWSVTSVRSEEAVSDTGGVVSGAWHRFPAVATCWGRATRGRRQVLVATGKEAELRLHLRGARNLGIERAALEAMMIHVSHYAGWPSGVSALRVLDEVWADMDAEAAAGADG